MIDRVSQGLKDLEVLLREKHGSHNQKAHGRKGSGGATPNSRFMASGNTFLLSRADVSIGQETKLPDGSIVTVTPGGGKGVTKFTRWKNDKLLQRGRFGKKAAMVKIPMKKQ